MTGAVISQNAAYFDFIADIHFKSSNFIEPALNTFKGHFKMYKNLKNYQFVPKKSMICPFFEHDNMNFSSRKTCQIDR